MRPHQHCTLPGPSMVVHVWKAHFRHPFSATPQSWLGTAKMFLSQHACGVDVNLSTLPSAMLNFLISSIFPTFFQSLTVLPISRSLLLAKYFWRWKKNVTSCSRCRGHWASFRARDSRGGEGCPNPTETTGLICIACLVRQEHVVISCFAVFLRC